MDYCTHSACLSVDVMFYWNVTTCGTEIYILIHCHLVRSGCLGITQFSGVQILAAEFYMSNSSCKSHLDKSCVMVWC